MTMRTAWLGVALLVGGAVGAVGCSDPTPDSPKGAVSIHLVQKSACGVPDLWADAPGVAGSHPIDGTQISDNLATDGENGARVTCGVAPGASGKFNVSGSISLGGVNVALSGQMVAQSHQSQQGQHLSVSASQLDSPRSSTDCTLTTLLIDQGKVWGSVTCASASNESSETCGIDEGYFVFENCNH